MLSPSLYSNQLVTWILLAVYDTDLYSFFPASRGLSRRNERRESLPPLIFVSPWETSASREYNSFYPENDSCTMMEINSQRDSFVSPFLLYLKCKFQALIKTNHFYFPWKRAVFNVFGTYFHSWGCLYSWAKVTPGRVSSGSLLWLCIRLHDATRECHSRTSFHTVGIISCRCKTSASWKKEELLDSVWKAPPDGVEQVAHALISAIVLTSAFNQLCVPSNEPGI